MTVAELEALVHEYLAEKRDCDCTEIDWFRSKSRSVAEAVETAALCIDRRNGRQKRFSHQRRIQNSARIDGRNGMRKILPQLQDCEDFDELFTLVEKTVEPIDGLGELYVYDVSLRIGARLGKLPERVYLHAGTHRGARALGLKAKTRVIGLSDLPKSIRKLGAVGAEDFLCVMKDRLSPLD